MFDTWKNHLQEEENLLVKGRRDLFHTRQAKMRQNAGNAMLCRQGLIRIEQDTQITRSGTNKRFFYQISRHSLAAFDWHWNFLLRKKILLCHGYRQQCSKKFTTIIRDRWESQHTTEFGLKIDWHNFTWNTSVVHLEVDFSDFQVQECVTHVL